MSKKPDSSGKLFAIYQRNGNNLMAVLQLPQETMASVVTAAWAYAVTYSAKGLNIPDYEAAVELMKKRHPSWQVIARDFIPIGLDLTKAVDDVTEE